MIDDLIHYLTKINRCRILLSLSWFVSWPALAIVVMPLPPVPDNPTTGTSTATTPIVATKNSAATQALLDQLFNDATYQKFSEQTPASLTPGDTP